MLTDKQIATCLRSHGYTTTADGGGGWKVWSGETQIERVFSDAGLAAWVGKLDQDAPSLLDMPAALVTGKTANKPKVMRTGNAAESMPFDRCQTPAYALDPLLPYLPRDWVIWEPAAGEGNICTALRSQGYTVIGSDLLTENIGEVVEGGRDFFSWQPPHFDAIVTNPPYSIKFPFYERCYALGKPFALLLPVEALGVGAAQKLYRAHGHEQLLLNKRVNFKMPNKGYSKKGWRSTAWFPTFWSCWQVLPDPVVYGAIVRREDEQQTMDLEIAA